MSSWIFTNIIVDVLWLKQKQQQQSCTNDVRQIKVSGNVDDDEYEQTRAGAQASTYLTMNDISL